MDNRDAMENEVGDSKFIEKLKQDPAVPIGIVGLTSVVAYGIYNFKKRGNKAMSIYLIHLRLAAQGTLLGCLTLGVIYTLGKNHYHKFFGDGDSSKKIKE